MRANNFKHNNELRRILSSRLFLNMSWLFILNFSNTIIPYFTFPYITRIFLPEGYGLISFSLSFVAYFITFIDYGFDLTGSRQVAINESDKDKVSKIFSTIFYVKVVFFIISVIIILIFSNSIEALSVYRSIILIFILMAFSHVINPTWLFQGLQNMKFVTVTSLSIRTVYLFFVFTLINSPEDISLYAFLHSMSFVLIGIVSWIIAKKKFGIRLVLVNTGDILEMIKSGFHIFTSSAVIKVMSATGVLVLGMFYLPVDVGYYSGISKITQVITMMFYPIGQALFPHQSKKYDKSFAEGYYSAFKTAKMLVPIFFVISIFIVLLRKPLILILLGKNYLSVSNLMIVLSGLPLLSIISNFMGTQILVASGHLKQYSRAFIRGGIIQVSLYLLMGYFLGMWGVAFAALIGACVNLLFLYIEIIKIKPRYEI